MCRFYGMSVDEARNMPVEIADQFWLAITQIEAQEMLIAMKVSDFPHLKKQSRESLGREIHKQAYPASFEKPKALSGKALEALINRGRR
jgi:hypothetical protein